MEPKANPSVKGVLKAEAGLSRFALQCYEPARELTPFIEHYWIVRWDLTGQQPYSQTVLSYPSVHLTFEQEASRPVYSGVYGVPSQTYTRTLRDRGATLGVKFHPGGFYPWRRQPVSRLTDRTISIREALGYDPRTLEQRMIELNDDIAMARLAENFLMERLPLPDENVAYVRKIVRAIIDDREITKVERIAAQFGIGARTLQRLFDRYVGVSPKWVIQRYRLQEAAMLLEQGGQIDGAALALELGFYDQAHFIKQFKAIIGKTPEAYAKDD
ncbi:MAG: AraC family transcriptional regulator [Cohnella sp.]|nr:AraC family transcriptional regulator [Cohnella sp.]